MTFSTGHKFYLTLLGFIAVIILGSTNANADYTISRAVNIGPPVNTSYDDSCPFISANGLSLFLATNRPGGSGDFDLWIATRTSTDQAWGEPVNMGQTINTSSLEWHPSITADGLELYFDSNRPGGEGSWDLWMAKRNSTQEPWGTPENLGPVINSSIFEESSSISGNGLTLLWNSKRPGGYGDSDIWMTTRSTRDAPWGEPVNIGPAINTELLESNAVFSSDGLAVFFTAWPWPDGYGDFDIWFSRQVSKDADWAAPVNLGPNVNTTYSEYCPNISSDGTMLYFSDWPTQRPGGNGAEDIWQASIEPVVDFNSDGNINTDDLLILMDNWNTSEPLCDIAPMPWGDGMVDMEDLKVFIRYWEQENFPDVNVDEDDNNGQVVLKQGQTLVVTLESNPSTGYRWEEVEDPNSILEQQGEAEFKPSSQGEPPMVGAGGWEIFRFKAVSAGQETLELIYRRPWETGSDPANTFSIDVIVN